MKMWLFAAAVALTKTAQDVRTALKDEMPRAFDRPTPYTLNSLFLKAAKPATLEATVWLKDNPFGKGTPADRYLGAQIKGGPRVQKKFERMLQRVGVLPAGYQIVPGAAAEIDAYGNMSRGQLVKVLSWMQSFGEQGYTKNTTAAGRAKSIRGTKRKAGIEYIVSKGERSIIKGRRMQHLPAGIYSKTDAGFGTRIRPIMYFVRSTAYQARYPFFEVAAKTVDQNFVAHFDRELASALQTARTSE